VDKCKPLIIGEAAAEALANADDAEATEATEATDATDAADAIDAIDVAPVPTVHVFNGHAKWSRSQLMNEIARGDWAGAEQFTT